MPCEKPFTRRSIIETLSKEELDLLLAELEEVFGRAEDGK